MPTKKVGSAFSEGTVSCRTLGDGEVGSGAGAADSGPAYDKQAFMITSQHWLNQLKRRGIIRLGSRW